MKKYLYIITLAIVSIFGLNACSKESLSPTSPSTGTGGSLARFTIYGNYLYIVDGSTLKTYSIQNPENPQLKSSIQVGIDIETIYPYQGKLFIGSATAMYIYSLNNPEQPRQEGFASHVRACDPVVAQDSLAYVTVRSTTNGSTCGGNVDALIIFNITNLQNPMAISTVNLNSPYGLGINGDYLYVCDGQSGLKVFDVDTPSYPRQIKTIAEYSFYDVIPYNDILICMVAGGMVIYDISEADNPTFVAKTF